MTINKGTVMLPDYFKKFKCIGHACEDTCCAGWGVPIDKKTYKKYKGVTNPKFKQKLRENVIRQRNEPTEKYFAKMKHVQMSCAFLNENKLCDIHSELGEEFLCHTCAEYPRTDSLVNNVFERSMTASCPESARLILLNEDGIQFEEVNEVKYNSNLVSKVISVNQEEVVIWQDFFPELRHITILILQNREMSLEERLILTGIMYSQLEELIVQNEINQIPNLLGQILNDLENTTYKNAFNNIESRTEIQIELIRQIVLLRLGDTITSKRYLDCSRQMMSGLKLDQDISKDEMKQIYNKYYRDIYSPFMDKHSYILENYLVNHVFKNCMPVDCSSPFESYSRLIIYYSIIKAHLIGISAFKGELTVDDNIKVIQSISKTFEHNTHFFEKVVNRMKENDLMDLTNMIILIRND